MVKNRVIYLILLVLSLVLYVFTNVFSTLLIFAVLLLLPMVSLLFMLHSSNSLSVEVNVPETVCKGEEMVAEIVFENKDILPVARVRFTLSLTNVLTSESVKSSFYCFVPGKNTQKCSMSLGDTHLGKLFISTEDLRIYDILGLFVKKLPGTREKTILVYPEYSPMSIRTENTYESFGDSPKYSEHKPGSDINEIFDIKDYTPGCEVRKIDWKLSGKYDKLIVREYGLPLNYSVYILTEFLSSHGADLVDSCVQFTSDLSLSLLEEGILHNMAWFDKKREALVVYPISTREEYEVALYNLVSSIGYEDALNSLNSFSESFEIDEKATVIYVTSETDEEKTSELSLTRVFKTVLIHGKQHYSGFVI